MKRTLRQIAAAAMVMLMAFTVSDEKKKITVYLVGDSTMSIKEKKNYPETGWGMPFAYFFDSTVKVDNRAMNGRSTKSFMAENRWQSVMDQLQEGDYVFVQFGHNDEVPTKKNHTTPDEFKANLEKYVSDTRSKKAVPVLITPVARRKFDAAGHITDTHAEFAAIVTKVAEEQKVIFIDLDKTSMELLEKTGVEPSKMFFNHLTPGEHPNYPEGKADDTHFSELGARRMAELVLADVRKVAPELADRIVKVKPK
jgi:lysophospholipase L1-like esterase